MINLTKLLFLTASIMTILTSCSSEQQAPKSAKKKYSSNTEKEFEQIERNDLQTPQYANVRWRDNNASMTRAKVTMKQKKIEPQIISNATLSEKNQERLQEINQNLTFFCMKHREDSNFSTEDKCLQFTKMVLDTCEKKHKTINAVMVSCIKERLKKRR